jgi:hypothetical protein
MSDKVMSSVTIDSPNGIGIGTVTTLNGDVVHGLTAIDVHIGLEEPNVVRLHLLAECFLNVEADPEFLAVMVNPASGEHHMGRGGDFVSAVRRLYEDVVGRDA